MLNRFSLSLILVGAGSSLSGCAFLAPPPPPAPSPSTPAVTTPIDRANQTTTTVEQKAQEREQLNPAAQPPPSP